MTTKIQLRRGTYANLPSLDDGEPGWVTDRKQLWIGQDGSSRLIGDNYVNVKSFGAVLDGVTDDGDAIRAARDSIPDGGIYYIPTGTARVCSNIGPNKDGQFLLGDGIARTNILFDPPSSATCIDCTHATASTTLWKMGAKGLTLKSTNTYTNTALNLTDVSSSQFEDIQVYDWTGTGLLLKGRDSTTFANMILDATSPIKFEENPNLLLTGGDHFLFRDLYLLAGSSTSKLIEVGGGIVLQNISFEGRQAWVLGKYGLYWVDNASASVSFHISLRNVRYEQAEDATGYFIYIDRTGAAPLRHLIIDSCNVSTSGGIDCNGVYLREINNAEIRNSTIFLPNPKVTLDIDETTYPVSLQNVLVHPTSPVINTGGLSTQEYHLGNSSEIDFAKYVLPVSGFSITPTPDDPTPSVAVGSFFATANVNPTVYSNFIDSHIGKKIVILIKDANTIVDFTGTNLKGNAGVDWSPTWGDWMECVFDGTNWYCSVHDCTA